MATADNKDICKFCNAIQRYSCPRCNAPYCSSKCYNSPAHSSCSEDFYKDSIEAELKGQNISEEGKRKMNEILKRMNDENEEDMEVLDSDDDEDSINKDQDDLADRIKDLDLNDTENLWKCLTESERKEFEKLVNSGDISSIMPSWTPWWAKEYVGKPLVAEISEDTVIDYEKECPRILQVPIFSKITTKTPSPNLYFNILNVLTAYSWVTRLFNGDHLDSCEESIEAMYLLSNVLRVNANFTNSDTAIECIFVEANNNPWLSIDSSYADTIRSDVQSLIKGPPNGDEKYFIKAALSDLYKLAQTTKDTLKKKATTRNKGEFAKKFIEKNNSVEVKYTTLPNIKLLLKKLEYFLSYIISYKNKNNQI